VIKGKFTIIRKSNNINLKFRRRKVVTKEFKYSIGNAYRIHSFEKQFEKTKKKGLELILAVQRFVVRSSREALHIVWEKVAEYWILFRHLRTNASREEIKYLVRLNKTIKGTIKDLDLEEVYLNILRKYTREINDIIQGRVKRMPA